MPEHKNMGLRLPHTRGAKTAATGADATAIERGKEAAQRVIDSSSTLHGGTAPADPATQFLTVTTQPATTATNNTALTTQPVVTCKDGSNATVAGFVGNVTAALYRSNNSLAGTVTKAAVAGVATFTDLKIVGTGIEKIIFTATGCDSGVSNAITVS